MKPENAKHVKRLRYALGGGVLTLEPGECKTCKTIKIRIGEGVYLRSNPENAKHVKRLRYALGGGVLTLEPGECKTCKTIKIRIGRGCTYTRT
ncbi:hypothetical protein HanPI659440_Chr10g0383061 [Helianthus annuus]|nr:hypothetical protein HanPI659440_Chr10g0383061 [Helianthus annuus]